MNKPYVIGISAVSGGGKTALARLVAAALPAAALFAFDDYDDTNVVPTDLYAWSQRGGDPREVDSPCLRSAVAQATAGGAYDYLVLDRPLGRDHPRFASLLDLAVFIDTPLDVAMTRRILRDHTAASDEPAEQRLARLRTELGDYLEKARYPYLNAYKQRDMSDLVLDGWLPLEALKRQVLEKIKT